MSLDISRPFRAGDALAAGMPKRRLSTDRFRKLQPGIYVSAGVQDVRHEHQALLMLLGDSAFLSHHQAARLYGAVVPHTETLHASVPLGRHRSRREGIAVHQSSRRPTTFRGIPVTTPEDTFLDLVPHLGLVDQVVLGDSLVRRGRTTPERLVAAAGSSRRWRAQASRAAGLVRQHVDSSMESRSRLLVVLAGLPEPIVNLCLYGPDGELLRRLDLAYPEAKLGIEYDGRHHAESAAQWASDISRREDLHADGWTILTLISRDIYAVPGRTIHRVVRAMHQVGMEVPPVSDEWRRHFRGH